jgi:hypothetical protein
MSERGGKGGVREAMLFIRPMGLPTDEPLCVHYRAYHRADVPAAELDAVWQLPAGADIPSPAELGAPEYRLRREPVDSIIWGVDEQIREEVDEEKEIVRWQYALVLDNRSNCAACVRQASFAL